MSTVFKSTSGPFNWINNQRVNPIAAKGSIKNLEPRSGKLLANVPISDQADVDRAVKAAKSAYQSWSQVKQNSCFFNVINWIFS